MWNGSPRPRPDDDGGARSTLDPPAPVPVQERPARPKPFDKKIYILGLEGSGKFLAHSFLGFPRPPPITFLSKSPVAWRLWEHNNSPGITLMRYGHPVTRYGCALERLDRESRQTSAEPYDARRSSYKRHGRNSYISQLIVNTKANKTAAAIDQISHRLDRHSTILFLCDGMGVMDEVNRTVFPDPAERPNYILGVVPRTFMGPSSHFHLSLDELGSSFYTIIPRCLRPVREGSPEDLVQTAPSAAYLLRTLTRSPELMAVGLPFFDLLTMKLERLAVRAVIDPLTTLYDCANGELLYNDGARSMMRLLLEEISRVLLSLPELDGLQSASTRFDLVRLKRLTISILEQSSDQRSLMLRDVEEARKTDVDFINGYVVRRSKELNIPCPTNTAMINSVKGKLATIINRKVDHVPFDFG
ncbi:MAG: hypothetical protein M1815_000276 [Lichina confinis]|nr:MAG: hypothetical protein M1815_000276 [Lichina confinis]